jgi:hypothetical protein
MHYAFPFLPLEVQTSINELIALGTPESAIDLLVARTAKAIEYKTTSLQRDLEQIDIAIQLRLDKIGDKLTSDLQTQHGATNQMLADLLGGQRQLGDTLVSQGAAVHELRAEFQSVGERIDDIERWRTEVNEERASFRESRDQSREQRDRTEQAVKAVATQLYTFIERIEGLIAQSVPPDKAQQYRAFLDELMRERANGGGNG